MRSKEEGRGKRVPHVIAMLPLLIHPGGFVLATYGFARSTIVQGRSVLDVTSALALALSLTRTHIRELALQPCVIATNRCDQIYMLFKTFCAHRSQGARLDAEPLQQRRHIIFAVRCGHRRRRPPVPVQLVPVDVQRHVQVRPYLLRHVRLAVQPIVPAQLLLACFARKLLFARVRSETCEREREQEFSRRRRFAPWKASLPRNPAIKSFASSRMSCTGMN
jgi:hypothetical protein